MSSDESSEVNWCVYREVGGKVAKGDKAPGNPLADLAGEMTGISREPGVLARALPAEQYLAAIVAHEMSNPFTALAGRVELVRSRKDLSAQMIRDLESMRTASERIDKLLRNLKSFSRRPLPPPRPLVLRETVEAAVGRFHEAYPAWRGTLTVKPGGASVRVNAEGPSLVAVIAATLEVLLLRDERVTSAELSFEVNPADEEARLVVIDNGPPLSEEECARVYHPFGGEILSAWTDAISLTYAYYVIRAWGGTYRFSSTAGEMRTAICLTFSE